MQGYFVSPKDPNDIHQCKMGDPALPNGQQDSSSCPGGNVTKAAKLDCIVNEKKQLISATDNKVTPACKAAVGALCGRPYSGDGAQACSKCCKDQERKPDGTLCDANYYHQSSDNTCLKCEKTSAKWLIAGTTVVAVMLAPILLKVAEAVKHAGALQGQCCPPIQPCQRQQMPNHRRMLAGCPYQCFHAITVHLPDRPDHEPGQLFPVSRLIQAFESALAAHIQAVYSRVRPVLVRDPHP